MTPDELRDDAEALARCRRLTCEAVARFRQEEASGLHPLTPMRKGSGVGSRQPHKPQPESEDV